MRHLWALVGAVMLGGASQAAAQATGAASDIHCMIVLAPMASPSESAATRQVARLSVIYYLGRLDGRTPAQDLDEALARYIVDGSPEEDVAARDRCTAEVAGRLAVIQEIGKRVIAREAKPPETPAPR